MRPRHVRRVRLRARGRQRRTGIGGCSVSYFTVGLDRVKQTYTVPVRRAATRSIASLARTRVSPNALTAAGVTLCLAAGVLVFFEDRAEYVFYWTGALL